MKSSMHQGPVPAHPVCADPYCDEVAYDRAVFMNPCMDFYNQYTGFCYEHLMEMVDPIRSEV